MKYIILIFLMSSNHIFADEKQDSLEKKKLNLPLVSYMLGVNNSNINHNIKDISTISSMYLNFSFQFIKNLDTLENNISSIIIRESFYYTNINYTISNRRIDGQKYDYSEFNSYIQFAVLYKHNIFDFIDNIFYLLTGPYVSYSINKNNKNVYNYSNKNEFHRFEFGMIGGIGYEYNFKTFSLGLEYNFQHALTNIYNNISVKNYSHFINVIYTCTLIGS